MSRGNLQDGVYFCSGFILKVTTGGSICHLQHLTLAQSRWSACLLQGLGLSFIQEEEKKNVKHDGTKTLSEL